MRNIIQIQAQKFLFVSFFLFTITYHTAWFDTFSVAACSKLLASISTYPHEVLRTRLRQSPENGIVKYKGLINTAKIIYREEGIAALYGGMTAHLMRVVPNAAILFFCYELIINLFEEKKN